VKLSRCIGLCVVLMLSGCGFGSNYVQFIVIDVYPDQDRNIKLTKDLLYYDHSYLTSNMPTLKSVSGKGVSLGYLIRATDGKPVYRIEYDLRVAAVEKNIEALQAGFKRFIPELVATHVAKEDLFSQLSDSGRAWLQSLYDAPANKVLSSSSILLREKLTLDQMTAFQNDLSSGLGRPESISFVRAQYYKKINDIPAFVSLHFLRSYKDNKELLAWLSFVKEGESWKVAGIRLDSPK